MAELVNCPSCNSLFIKNKFREICEACYKEEEQAYETVYKFMRNRENRAATIPQITEATNVNEDLLYKFIRTGRLKVTQFPNLGYPCDKCGSIIQKGKLCNKCIEELQKELAIFEADEQRQKELKQRHKTTYFTSNDNKRKP